MWSLSAEFVLRRASRLHQRGVCQRGAAANAQHSCVATLPPPQRGSLSAARLSFEQEKTAHDVVEAQQGKHAGCTVCELSWRSKLGRGE